MSEQKKSFFATWHPNPGDSVGKSIRLVCRPGGDVLVRSETDTGFPEYSDQAACPADWQRLSIGTLGDQTVMLVSAPLNAPAPAGYLWTNIRPLFGGLDSGEIEALSRASMLASWDSDHRYCGRCGTITERDTLESARVCPACHHRSYPRVSPAMIVRITDGEKILLAHNSRFPDGVYSCIAGYVEPGETLENTVIREIREEVGLIAAPPKYLSSQAWPFPHSLMLGFETTATGNPVPDGVEISDAQWFSCDNLPHIPRHGTIARWLIDEWLMDLGILDRNDMEAT